VTALLLTAVGGTGRETGLLIFVALVIWVFDDIADRWDSAQWEDLRDGVGVEIAVGAREEGFQRT
jgi:hypothetical protein